MMGIQALWHFGIPYPRHTSSERHDGGGQIDPMILQRRRLRILREKSPAAALKYRDR